MGNRCPKCQFDNPPDTLYCGKCATPLPSPEEISVSHTKTLETPVEELTRGTTFAGRYEIIEELGKGGMGKVYRSYDKQLKEEVALKLIKPEIASDKKTLDRFSNELKIARKIVHKNVGRMYELMKNKGVFFITMEYVPGQDLKGLIRQSGQLAVGTTISIAKQVCEGLAEAHKLGVIHRDLKPSNIMIDKGGNARIMDFGIARSLETKGITGAGVIIGTPEYMSPEQVEAKETDQRSDIYSLGVILYEMVTGRVPFEGDTPFSIGMKHKGEMPQNPKEINTQISDDLNRVILRCLEKEKEKRYQSAGEVRSELTNIEKGIPSTERLIPKRKTTTSKEITVTFRKRWIVFTVLFVVVVSIGIALLFLGKGKPVSPPEEKRLLVLPFENLGASEDAYFAEGIADEIMARLVNIEGLSVIARNTAIQYKNSEKSLKEIGEELKVNYILSGTVRWQRSKEGPSQVRVTPQLIRISDSTNVWSDVYDKSIKEVFAVQSDIAKKVVEALDIALLEPDRQAMEAKPTENIDAYDYYLRGKEYIYYRYDNEPNLRFSVNMFEKATELDPNFAHAFANLARAHAHMYWYYYDRTDERAAMAKAAADRALQIDPDLPEAHLALGWYYYHVKLGYEHALEQFRIAQRKQPKNKDIFEAIGYVCRRQGKMELALENLTKAFEIDPLAPILEYNIGETYVLVRNYLVAERHLNHAVSMYPEYARSYSWRARMYFSWDGNTERARFALEEASKIRGLKDDHFIIYPWILADIFDGQFEDALARLSATTLEAFATQFYFVPKELLYAQIYELMDEKLLAQQHYIVARDLLEARTRENPEDSRYYSSLGMAYAGLDKKQDAIRTAEKAVELLPISKEAYRGIFRAKDSALVYTMVGEYDKAIDKIEYLLSIPGEMSIPLLLLDPRWAPLREHPRFQKLLEREKSKNR